MPVDILAIAAHRDDVELTCAGTLLKAVDAGYRTGILDLTAGETGTRGSAEAASGGGRAGVPRSSVWRSGGTPACPTPTFTTRMRRGGYRGRRSATSRLAWSSFPSPSAGTPIIGSPRSWAGTPATSPAWRDTMRPGTPHRPHKILYALSYREDPIKPTFVVDISEQFDRKLAAIKCYGSQFDGAKAAGEIFPTGQDLYSLVETQNAHYGSLIRTRYGEPFFTHETVEVDDVVKLGVQSM